MTNNRLVDERSIFLQVLELDSAEARAAFLDEVCGTDASLRRKIDDLLEAHERPLGLLDLPDRDTPTELMPPAGDGAGAQIGPYTLLEPIGEGGMGTVYMAEQTEPVRRKVALKVVKPGMDSKQVITRFEAERQALALMDHPNIAKVHDAGTTGSGRPYFVMELVNGIPITEYCERERLSLPERLELFVLVCRAVQHAHQKGVIHRDLKPSNVLVTMIDGVAVPKVIDFGVAKATGQSLTDRTVYTAFQQLVGTPLYMSPEQAALSGVDVDTRSDIYSLGVMLYELLIGTTPFDRKLFQTAAFDEIRRIIREEDPPKLNTRLSSLSNDARTDISQRRRTDPRNLTRLVTGDLNSIVMKALDKDRERRYETANGLAADVVRHLNAQPVVACPASPLYRFRKFARRNRGVLVSILAVAAVLIVGTGVSVWQALLAKEAAKRANASAREANIRAEESKQVIDYLTEGLFIKVAQGDRSMTLGQFFDQVEATLESDYQDKPLVYAQILLAVSEVQCIQNRMQNAIEVSDRAVTLLESALGPEHPVTLEARERHAEYLCWAGWRNPSPIPTEEENEPAEEAESLLVDILEARRRILGIAHPDTIKTQAILAITISHLGRQTEARGVAEEAVGTVLRALGPNHESTLVALHMLAWIAYRQQDFELAIATVRQVLVERDRLLGPLSRLSLNTCKDLAWFLWQAGDLEGARTARLETIRRYTMGMGFTTSWTNIHRGDLLFLLQAEGESVLLRGIWQNWLRELLSSPIPTDAFLRERRRETLAWITSTLLGVSAVVPIDVQLAERAVEQLEMLSPDSSRAIALRVALNASIGDLEEARFLVASHLNDIREDYREWNNVVWYTVRYGASPEWAALAATIMGEVREARPDAGWLWGTLGIARYRAGDWAGAIAALDRSRELNHANQHLAVDGFFLAMAHARLGDEATAHEWFEKSVGWMLRSKPYYGVALKIFRAEAAELLGLALP